MKIRTLKKVVLGVLAVTLVTALTGCGKKTIDVSETVKAEFEGYDGYGVCTIENEYDWIDNALELYGDKFDDLSYDLMDSVTYKMSKQENLSNGDTVTVTPVIGSEAEDYAFNLTGEPVTFTVEGLQEVEEFDPFDNITVSFEGISPNGTAVITEKKDNSVSYKPDKQSGLSNGDTITVTANSFLDMNEYAMEYGKVFSTTEKKPRKLLPLRVFPLTL